MMAPDDVVDRLINAALDQARIVGELDVELVRAREENQKMKAENERLMKENKYLADIVSWHQRAASAGGALFQGGSPFAAMGLTNAKMPEINR